MEKAETLCISPILSYSRSSEKSSSRYGHNNSNNSSLTKQSLYPKILQISISNPILILLTFYWTQRLKRTSCDKQDTAIRGLCSFWKKLSAEELSEQAISLSLPDVKTIDTINHNEPSWTKWINWFCDPALDPICCNINHFLEFLTELFNKGKVKSAWKVSVFGVTLVRIQSKCWKILNRITPCLSWSNWLFYSWKALTCYKFNAWNFQK